jgi:hypothetical protein
MCVLYVCGVSVLVTEGNGVGEEDAAEELGQVRLGVGGGPADLEQGGSHEAQDVLLEAAVAVLVAQEAAHAVEPVQGHRPDRVVALLLQELRELQRLPGFKEKEKEKRNETQNETQSQRTAVRAKPREKKRKEREGKRTYGDGGGESGLREGEHVVDEASPIQRLRTRIGVNGASLVCVASCHVSCRVVARGGGSTWMGELGSWERGTRKASYMEAG